MDLWVFIGFKHRPADRITWEVTGQLSHERKMVRKPLGNIFKEEMTNVTSH